MNDAGQVEVLLATYNSERHLERMLVSLTEQTFQDFQLVVGDDASTDDTLKIVAEHAARFHRPPRIVRRERPSGGASANFGLLLAESDADYVLLADHDDEWLPHRIATGLEAVRSVEAGRGTHVPVLAHTDLRVVDAEGATIAESYWQFKRIDPGAGDHLSRSLVHATVTGCTVTMNRALVRKAVPVPPEAVMHDWWLGLVATSYGALVHVAEPTVRYRVHGANVSRPRRGGLTGALGRVRELPAMRGRMEIRYDQAAALAARMDDLGADHRRVLDEFARVRRLPPGARQLALVRGGYTWPDALRNLAHLPFA